MRILPYCTALAVRGIGRWAGVETVSSLLPVLSRRTLPLVLRAFGAEVGEDSRFKEGLRIDNAAGDQDSTGDYRNLIIGRRCYVGRGVLFDLPDRIEIADEVALSAGVTILTHADCGKRAMSAWYPRRRGPVRIGFGCWVGANAVILAGVTLGRCCVVAAGAVVTRSVPDYSVVMGIPGTVRRSLMPEIPAPAHILR